MSDSWFEILYFDGVGIHFAYGTLSGSLEQEVLSRKPDQWVRLNRVRWLNESGTYLEKLEDDLVGTEGHFYLRASSIIRVAPIQPDISFWEEGIAPLRDTIESEENN